MRARAVGRGESELSVKERRLKVGLEGRGESVCKFMMSHENEDYKCLFGLNEFQFRLR